LVKLICWIDFDLYIFKENHNFLYTCFYLNCLIRVFDNIGVNEYECEYPSRFSCSFIICR